jgi:hypothetical protein
MAIYTIQQGDYVARVAFQHGFRSYLTIYDDGANAAFREKRPNPDILFPGDQLTIPEKEGRVEHRATGARHRFVVVDRTKVLLRVIVKDRALRPLAGKRYTLRAGAIVITEADGKRTGGDGLIEHELEPSVTQASLAVFLTEGSDEALAWTLRIGHLNPISEVTGVKARLDNLGFECGSADAQIDEQTVRALTAFRQAMGITVPPGQEATIDQPTRDRLEKEHGS